MRANWTLSHARLDVGAVASRAAADASSKDTPASASKPPVLSAFSKRLRMEEPRRSKRSVTAAMRPRSLARAESTPPAKGRPPPTVKSPYVTVLYVSVPLARFSRTAS